MIKRDDWQQRVFGISSWVLAIADNVQKVKVRKWLTFKEKIKVIDEVKRAKPVMDVAAEFGVVLCYYQPPARLMLYTTGMYVITTNTLNCCFPHMNRYWHKQSLTHRASSTVELFSLPKSVILHCPMRQWIWLNHCFVSLPGDLRDKENTYTIIQ